MFQFSFLYLFNRNISHLPQVLRSVALIVQIPSNIAFSRASNQCLFHFLLLFFNTAWIFDFHILDFVWDITLPMLHILICCELVYTLSLLPFRYLFLYTHKSSFLLLISIAFSFGSFISTLKEWASWDWFIIIVKTSVCSCLFSSEMCTYTGVPPN